jgi:glycine/D-amino acid oxidase-like deaminating enzyme
VGSSTAIVLGGGVIGLSTAYHLARKRFGRVILLDKGPVGDGSSSRAAGIITNLLWSETGVRVRNRSVALFRELSQDLDGYSFQDVGCLNLFDPQSWLERKQLLPLYEQLGVPFEILDSAEVHRCWSDLHPHESFIGLFDPLGGYSEPHDYIPALAKRNRELGVEIREHQLVTGFLEHSGRMRGVTTTNGDVEGDAVVCTVYAWTNNLIERLGLRLPVKAFVHQRYVTGPLPARAMIPAVNANPLGGYIRPAHGDRLLAGIETLERIEYRVPSLDFHMSALSAAPDLKDKIMDRFTPLVPALKHASWEAESVGLITLSMDGEPILGPVRAIPGLYIGVAFHSGGFAYNPVAGLLLAEFVADGHTSIDVSAFSSERFDASHTDGFLAATIAQKHVVSRRH